MHIHTVLDLYNGFVKGKIPELDMSASVYAFLSVGIILKVGLYVFCSWATKILSSDILGNQTYFSELS